MAPTGSEAEDPRNVKASVLHGVRDLRIDYRSLGSPAPLEAQVAVLATGLCGSDLHYFSHYRNGDILVREPLTLGHESAGVVCAVGSEVTHLAAGDRVALEVGLPCSQCDLCSGGRYNICKELRFRSSAKSFPHCQGTLQERINHPALMCHKLPDAVSLEVGALLEPLSVAIHALRRASLKQGSSILIFGAGAVGILCAAMCKISGAKSILIADAQADRVDFAVLNGFATGGITVPLQRPTTVEQGLAFSKDLATRIHATQSNTGSPTGEVDAVFECTGAESCLQTAIYATRPGGKIMLIGMGHPVQTLPISAAALREVDLIGVFRYATTYEDAIRLVTSDNPLLPDLKKLVTQRFEGLESVPRAFDMAGRVKDENGDLVLKVLLDTTQH